MPRARKPTHVDDGMNLLQVMPFPALNPWNWWALTAPRNTVLATLSGAQAAMQAWRCGVDAVRTALRAQQDALVSALTGTLASSEEPTAPEDAASEGQPSEAATFVAPMLAATRAYSTMGKAFIIAQRDTLRAFSGAGKPH